MHPSSEDAERSTTFQSPERPRWIAFGVILATVLALVVAPSAVRAAITPMPEGTVGVYERVTLHGDFEAGEVVGGFIAPYGWVWVDAPSDNDAAEGSAQRFKASDGSTAVTVSAQALVDAPDDLLRTGAPVGAALAPIVRLESAPLLTADLLEYDLAAGDGVSQRIVVCEVLTDAACLLFEVEMRADIAGSYTGQMLPDVAAMVASTEVLPIAEAQS